MREILLPVYYPTPRQARPGARCEEVPGWGHVAPGTATRSDNAHEADLVSYWGGRNRLPRVRDVAEQIGVCSATVYRLVESGDLPHIRIVNSIRIRPDDLRALLEREASERSSTDR